MTTMRAKLSVSSVKEHFNGKDEVKSCETLTMHPVCKSTAYDETGLDEDNSFATWTPSGHLELQITNPALWGQFKPNQKFYVDFTEAE